MGSVIDGVSRICAPRSVAPGTWELRCHGVPASRAAAASRAARTLVRACAVETLEPSFASRNCAAVMR